MSIDFEDPTTWGEPLTDADALSMGIFAMNTMKEPQGSTDSQMDALDFFTEGSIERLVALRDRIGGVAKALRNLAKDVHDNDGDVDPALLADAILAEADKLAVQ